MDVLSFWSSFCDWKHIWYLPEKEKKHNKICLTVKLELAKYYKDSEMTALSPKGAGIKNSWRGMSPPKLKNKVGHTFSTILNYCSFQR